MELLTLPVLIGLVGLLLGGVRLAWVWWKGATASAVERKMLELAAAIKGWAAYLRRRNREIDQQPPPATDQELQDRINEEWNQKP